MFSYEVANKVVVVVGFDELLVVVEDELLPPLPPPHAAITKAMAANETICVRIFIMQHDN